jgi:hypothetical protein
MKRFALVLVLTSSIAHAQEIEPMPETHGLDPATAQSCSRGDVDACVSAGDAAFRASDAARANALYRRGADLARRALHVPARPTTPGRIHTAAAAITALEGAWTITVARGAGAHGQRGAATAAQPQVFGEAAVGHWTARRATIADAFGAVHTWMHREGGTFANGVWVGDLRLLAADGQCWQLTFAYQNLDFIAFVDDHAHVIAFVRIPEG